MLSETSLTSSAIQASVHDEASWRRMYVVPKAIESGEFSLELTFYGRENRASWYQASKMYDEGTTAGDIVDVVVQKLRGHGLLEASKQ